MALTGAVAAAVVALAVLGAGGDADTALVFAPSSLAPFEAELDAALIESGIGPVEWVFAGSQSLVAQLIDGAPADVLITADAVTFARANAAGVTWDDGRDLVANRLVLAVAPGNPGGVASLDDLGRSGLLVGVCAPEVPCGRLAVATTDGRVTIDADTEETNVRALTTSSQRVSSMSGSCTAPMPEPQVWRPSPTTRSARRPPPTEAAPTRTVPQCLRRSAAAQRMPCSWRPASST